MEDYPRPSCCKSYVSEFVMLTVFMIIVVGSVVVYGLNTNNAYNYFNPMMVSTPLYCLVVLVVVQIIYSQLSCSERLRVSGTWSSMMSAEGVYGSKFLLFSMTIICYGSLAFQVNTLEWLTAPELMKEGAFLYWMFFAQVVVQPLLLLIGFFPSNLNGKDSFIYEEEVFRPEGCRKYFSLAMHYFGSLVYGAVMVVSNIAIADAILRSDGNYNLVGGYSAIVMIAVQIILLALFLVMQAIYHFRRCIFNSNVLNRFSIALEILFLFFCVSISALNSANVIIMFL